MKMAQSGGKLSEFEDKDKLVARSDKYQKWAEKMEFEIKKDNSLVRVALYAIDGKDDMKPPEELPGEDAATIEKNKDIKEQKRKFTDATVTFFTFVWNNLSNAVKGLVKKDPDYDEAVTDARKLWNLIRKVVVARSSSGPAFNSINSQLYRIRQEGNETIDDYVKRLKDSIEAFKLIGGVLDTRHEAQLFLNGLHPKYSRVKQVLSDDAKQTPTTIKA